MRAIELPRNKLQNTKTSSTHTSFKPSFSLPHIPSSHKYLSTFHPTSLQTTKHTANFISLGPNSRRFATDSLFSDNEDVDDTEKNEEEPEQCEVLRTMPTEAERVQYYTDFKINNELECAKFMKMMRTLPIRELSLEEQDTLFKKRDLVERKLKVIKAQREDSVNTDDILDAIDDLYVGETDPIINPALKETLYETWVQSPTQWTLEKLAQRFRLKKLRVRAILMLKIDEKRLLKSAPADVIPEGDNVDYEYARYYGMIGKNQHFVDELDERYIMTYRTSPFAPFFAVTDEEVDGERMKRMALTKKKKADTLPADPPNPDGRNDSLELWRSDPYFKFCRIGKKRMKRKVLKNTLVVMFDPDKPLLHEKINGVMYVVRPNGSARTANWDERRAFWRQNPRGEFAAKTLQEDRIAMDPIYFPVDEDEERMMKIQERSPFIQNRKWNKPVIITEKETFIHRMTGRETKNVFKAWDTYKEKYGELLPDSTIFDAPPPTAPYAGTPVVYY